MKARVKETGKIVDVTGCGSVFRDRKLFYVFIDAEGNKHQFEDFAFDVMDSELDSMEKIIGYVVKGKRFDDPMEALKYETLCERVEDIMSSLEPRTERVDNGLEYIPHGVTVVKDSFKEFCDVCGDTIPRFKNWFVETGNGERHISHVGKILSDYSEDYPILQKTLFRFECISFENGYEFMQPYYVTHQEEFFEDMKKRLEYEGSGN